MCISHVKLNYQILVCRIFKQNFLRKYGTLETTTYFSVKLYSASLWMDVIILTTYVNVLVQ